MTRAEAYRFLEALRALLETYPMRLGDREQGKARYEANTLLAQLLTGELQIPDPEEDPAIRTVRLAFEWAENSRKDADEEEPRARFEAAFCKED